jgi:HSP20 family molecular chaperone IbpA
VNPTLSPKEVIMSRVPNSRSDTLRAAISKLVGEKHSAEEAAPVWEPAYDVLGNAAEMVVIIDLPGVDEDEIVIEAKGDALKIRASREFDHDSEDAEDYARIGRLYGVFVCSVPLHDNANPHGMTAKYKRGVLKVRVPRTKDKC